MNGDNPPTKQAPRADTPRGAFFFAVMQAKKNRQFTLTVKCLHG